jgi:acyl-[acyl-carrier-protein]-phospholipid O-acyltransferase/long-chain-fatty-acid--[acyl-carrier-protein] ligase
VRKVLALNTVDEHHEVLAVNLPDEKKGERIILLISSLSTSSNIPLNTENDKVLSLSDVRHAMIDNQCNPLMIPSELIIIEALPKLGTGKMDTATAKKIALAQTTKP